MAQLALPTISHLRHGLDDVMQNYARLGTFGILALIALRLGIGWHFYMEGASKIRGGDFSSVGFVNGAKGPLADQFQSLVWDHDGSLRLDQAKINGLFTDAANNAAKHFGFSEEQQKQLSRMVMRYAGQDSKKQYVGKLNEVFAESEEDIFKYWQNVERLQEMDQANAWNDVASLRGQKEKIETDRMSSVKSALASIDAIWKQYEGQINSIATPEQFKKSGFYRFSRPGEGPLSTSTVDRIIPYFDLTIGGLLIVGLFTPLAGWAAALFLLSVVLSQMPGFPGTQPTYFQAVEALACVALATCGAGRFAGLDFILWARRQNQRAAVTS